MTEVSTPMSQGPRQSGEAGPLPGCVGQFAVSGREGGEFGRAVGH